jgi:diguanylate cyclase (GGDEF)-like protein/PAS domain S-box-containing protein
MAKKLIPGNNGSRGAIESALTLNSKPATRLVGGQLTEHQFRSFLENLPVLFYAVDSSPPYRPLYVSPEFAIFGYPMDFWTSNPDVWLRVIHPEDRDWVFNQTTESTASGQAVDYEWRIIDAEGSIHWVKDRGCLVLDDDGKVLCREGVMLDITDRKCAEEALRQSEQRLRSLFENANDIIYVHDLEGNYLSMNHAAEQIFGYTSSEAREMNITQIVVPDQLELARTMLNKKLHGATHQTAYELDCVKRNGEIVTLEVNSTLIRNDGKAVAVQGIARDVTERKHAEDQLRESENRYKDLFENANDLIYTHDLKGNITSLNRAGERITGYSRDEAVAMNISQVVAPESLESARQMTAKKLHSETPPTYEIVIIAKDGRRVSLELSTRLIYEKGVPIGVQGVGRDITERRRTEEALRISERRYRQLGEGISHQVWTAEPNGRLDYVNERTLHYFKMSSGEITDGGWPRVVHPDDLDECLRRWNRAVETGEFYEAEFRLRRNDGEYRWFKARANAGRDSDGKITKWYGTNTDIDSQKQSEAKLNYFARHDPLTTLPNRIEFMRHLKAAVDRAQNRKLARFAVLFLDLDRFKVVNDSLGHFVGDKLLKAIADRLVALVRPGDIVARIGGDEFTILLNRTGGVEDVEQIAERLQRTLSQPFMIDNYEVFTSASIGIIVADEIKRKPEDFLRDADFAMYRAKEAGKARYEVFDRKMHARNMNMLKIETDLRHAVDRREFEVLYQPIVDLDSGQVREFEALIRWEHPELGLIQPDQFVNLAEETGMIVPIGKWILEEACQQIAKWQDHSRERLSISVNLSAKQLMHPLLTEQVQEILGNTGLTPDQLKLEVTESTLMEHNERSLSVLFDLDRLGISLSTDDFGTGYSSLSYLHGFPFQRLKIDRSFIEKMGENEKGEAIVKTILMLGENLGIEVVAEGIETREQLDSLKTFGCRLGQGFLFSVPVNATEAEKLLTKAFNHNWPDFPPKIHMEIPIFEVTNIH